MVKGYRYLNMEANGMESMAKKQSQPAQGNDSHERRQNAIDKVEDQKGVVDGSLHGVTAIGPERRKSHCALTLGRVRHVAGRAFGEFVPTLEPILPAWSLTLGLGDVWFVHLR